MKSLLQRALKGISLLDRVYAYAGVWKSELTIRHALLFGNQKLNLHQSGKEFEPKASKVQPGSEDICFITDHPVDKVLDSWKSAGMEVLEGSQVVDRTGAVGKLRSVYCRDPDGNLIEYVIVLVFMAAY